MVSYTCPYVIHKITSKGRHAEIEVLSTRPQRRGAACSGHRERFRQVVPAKTVAGCGAKARDWSARAAAAARAQGRRFSREQCQMVHLSR
ncbi:unnamed protein product [Arctia plantaginis]|uniref:Uncharacterized protein n=1 Tax=Arctia plantaginis TaxID=874455 RepID=A0A8S0YPX6_ARCPL|nr:unnamed protein product [Arctia plantaginis]CAB3261592.1 unnamed protein product [Arctia plantaginis]